MAVPVWPATLPQRFQKDGYQESAGDGRLRSQMDVGPAKIRRRGPSIRRLSGTMFMTNTQFGDFFDFIGDEGDTLGRSLPFYFPQQRSGAGTWLTRFTEDEPTYAPLGIQWRVSFALEILP